MSVTRLCDCGCGETFEVPYGYIEKRFKDRDHAQRGLKAERCGAPMRYGRVHQRVCGRRHAGRELEAVGNGAVCRTARRGNAG